MDKQNDQLSFIEYQNMLIIENLPPYNVTASFMQKKLLETKCILTRWVSDFDCKYQTPWYYVCLNHPILLEELKKDKRYDIKKGLKNYTAEFVEPNDEIIQSFYDVYYSVSKNYNSYSPQSFESFKKSIISDNQHKAFACYDKEKKVVGFCTITFIDNKVIINTMKILNEAMKKNATYALIYIVVGYCFEKGAMYITNGTTTLDHKTNINDFLIRDFGFEKVYCNLNIIYRKWLKIIVFFFYPFRWLFVPIKTRLFRRITAVLKQERIRRVCKKISRRSKANESI